MLIKTRTLVVTRVTIIRCSLLLLLSFAVPRKTNDNVLKLHRVNSVRQAEGLSPISFNIVVEKITQTRKKTVKDENNNRRNLFKSEEKEVLKV